MNVLWICTDQQRFDTLGCYGNEYVSTPNLDKLAEKGVLFENAYCQNPTCTPSRASFLTVDTLEPRCRQNGQEMPMDEKLISKLSRARLYMWFIRKLHLNPCNLVYAKQWKKNR